MADNSYLKIARLGCYGLCSSHFSIKTLGFSTFNRLRARCERLLFCPRQSWKLENKSSSISALCDNITINHTITICPLSVSTRIIISYLSLVSNTYNLLFFLRKIVQPSNGIAEPPIEKPLDDVIVSLGQFPRPLSCAAEHPSPRTLHWSVVITVQ